MRAADGVVDWGRSVRTTAVVLGSAAAALAVSRLVAKPALGSEAPTFVFTLAVIVLACLAGRGPGLFTTALLAGFSVALMPPPDVAGADPEPWMHLVVFLIVGTTISMFSGALRDSWRHLQRTTAAAQQSQRRISEILSSITDCYAAFDRDFRVLDANDHALAFAGVTREQAIGAVLWDLLPPLRGTIVEQEFRRAAEQRIPVHFETPDQILSGQWAEAHVYPSYHGFSLYFRDITPRKRVEAALKRATEELDHRVRLRTAELAQANESLRQEIERRHDAEQRVRRLAEFEGLVRALATSFINLHIEQIDQGIERALAAVSGFAGADRAALCLLSPDQQRITCTHEWCAGGLKPVAQQFQPIPTPRLAWMLQQYQRGQIVHVCCLEELPPEAVGEREAAQQTSAQSLLAAPLLCEGRLVGFVAFAAVFRENDWPEEVSHLLGVVAEMLVSAVERKTAQEALRQAHEQLERTVRERTGDLAMANQQLRNQIVENRQAQEQLEHAKAQADAANAAKDTFLAILSHELRTPLSPVLLQAGVLETDPTLPQSLRDDMAMIRANIELESRLIEDLLDLTRIARGKMQLRRQPADLHELLEHVLRICDEDVRGKKLHVMARCEAGERRVNVDTARVQQVFWNLIKNAVKFTPPGGRIDVRTSNPGPGQIRVEVSDSGIGIPPEALDRIFNAFEQQDRTISGTYGGLGLGLAICRAVVEQHGGWIRACSAGKGKGATIAMELPLAPAPAADEARPAPLPAPVPVQGQVEAGLGAQVAAQVRRRQLQILLVEDHPHTAEVLSRLLARSGHQVSAAGGITTALTLAGQQRFDVLISDIGLPDGSGLDLMRQLRQQYNLRRGIALSGYGMEDDVRRSKDAGFSEHLTKPVRYTDIQAALARVEGDDED